MATSASRIASPTSSSPSRRFACWPCATTCATSAGVTGSDTASYGRTECAPWFIPTGRCAGSGRRQGSCKRERIRRTTAPGAAARATDDASTAPERAGLVLTALIVVAGVANLNLSVANVALPDIGKHFDSSQTTLDLIAVGYSLGLACSVLWLGALGDRYGRKLMLLLGTALAIPMSLLAAFAPSDTVLFLARLGGGFAAGMAYPTTLALITALWAGPGRTKSIALWSALGGAIAMLGPLLSGFLLEHFYWGSVFLITLPLAVVAIVLAWLFVPAHVNESTEPVDNLGGILSLVLVGALILAINFAPVPNKGTLTLVLAADRGCWRSSRSTSASAARRTRSTTSTSPPAASSGSRPAPGSSSSAR